MAKLIFVDKHGNKHFILDVEHIEGAIHEINRYCEIHGIRLKYMRMWTRDIDGKQVDVVDIGSHTEFFHIEY